MRKTEPPRAEPPARLMGPAARIIALRYAEKALGRLATLVDSADTDAAKIAACKEILDRAYGKAPQAITGENGGAVKNEVIVRIIEAGVGARHPASIAAISDADDEV